MDRKHEAVAIDLAALAETVKEVVQAFAAKDAERFLRAMAKVPPGAVGPHSRQECFLLLHLAVRWLGDLAREGNQTAGSQLADLLAQYSWLSSMATQASDPLSAASDQPG